MSPAALLPAVAGHHRSKGPHAAGAPPLPEHEDPGLASTEFCPDPSLPTAPQELSLPHFSNTPPTQRVGWLLRQRSQCCEREAAMAWEGTKSLELRGCPSAGPRRRAGCWGQGPGDAKRRARSVGREPLPGLRDSRHGSSPRH